ncbi:MAG: VOC family protein [Solirubrobacterales bacterium]
MGLSELAVTPAIAVADIGTAREFYEGKLGLSNPEEQPDGGLTYPCAGGTSIHVYPSPENAGSSTATLAFWETDDPEGVVDDLSAKGVTFEQYDVDPIRTDERGIATMGSDRVAWFKDPDGNILAVGT